MHSLKMTSIFSTIAITAAGNYHTCYDNEMGPLRDEPFSGSWSMVYNADTEIGVCDYVFNACHNDDALCDISSLRIQIETGDECRLNPGGSGTSTYGANVTAVAGVATGSLSWVLGEGFDPYANNLLMVYDDDGICIGCTQMQSSDCPATNAPSASPSVMPTTKKTKKAKAPKAPKATKATKTSAPSMSPTQLATKAR